MKQTHRRRLAARLWPRSLGCTEFAIRLPSFTGFSADLPSFTGFRRFAAPEIDRQQTMASIVGLTLFSASALDSFHSEYVSGLFLKKKMLSSCSFVFSFFFDGLATISVVGRRDDLDDDRRAALH